MDTRYINIYYVLEHFCFFSVEVKSANVFFLLSDIEMDEFMPNYINWTIYFIFKNNELLHLCRQRNPQWHGLHFPIDDFLPLFFPHSATYPSFCSLYSISLDYIWSNSPSYSSPKRLVCPAQCIIAVLSYILVWNLLFLPPFSQLTKCVIWEILYFCLWDVSWFLPWIAPYSSSLAPCA